MADPVDRPGGLTADLDGPGAVSTRSPVDAVDHASGANGVASVNGVPLIPEQVLTPTARQLLSDLFAIIEEHADETALPVDRDRVTIAFLFSCRHHAEQRRKSGEEFI